MSSVGNCIADMVVEIDRHQIVGQAAVRQQRAPGRLHGLTRSLVANMVQGVSEGYTRYLDIVGVGYKAAMQGKALQIHIGYSHPVLREPPKGINFEVEQVRGAGFTLVVRGINKELVGQVSAELRSIRPPEPYKGKGIKYRGEVIARKVGKAGKTGK